MNRYRVTFEHPNYYDVEAVSHSSAYLIALDLLGKDHPSITSPQPLSIVLLPSEPTFTLTSDLRHDDECSGWSGAGYTAKDVIEDLQKLILMLREQPDLATNYSICREGTGTIMVAEKE